MQIQVFNKSKSLAGHEDLIVAMCDACTVQFTQHAAPAWDRLPATVTFSANAQVIAGALPVYLFDDADQAGTLGYHDETPAGRPYARVFAKTILDYGGTILGLNGIAAVLSHEVLEMWGDPTINYWGQAATGELFAMELGDACENDGYAISVGTHSVYVSNFLLPHWFDTAPPAGSHFDYMHKLRAPFTMDAGGYVIVMKGGKVSQRFAANYPEWKKRDKEHPASRASRRGCKVARTFKSIALNVLRSVFGSA